MLDQDDGRQFQTVLSIGILLIPQTAEDLCFGVQLLQVCFVEGKGRFRLEGQCRTLLHVVTDILLIETNEPESYCLVDK